MKHEEQDPQRWADRADGPTIDDRVGAEIRRMGQPVLPDDAAMARLQRRVAGAPSRRPRMLVRLAIACGVTLVFVGGAVSAQLGHFPFRRERPPLVDRLTVPRGSTVRLYGKRQRKMVLVGPGELTVGAGADDGDALALREGLLAIGAGEQPVAVSADDARVTFPAGGAGAVSVGPAGAPEVVAIAGRVRVTSSAGTTTLAQGQAWRRGSAEAASSTQLDRAAQALSDEPVAAPAAPVAPPPSSPSSPSSPPSPLPAPSPAPVAAAASSARRAAPPPTATTLARVESTPPAARPFVPALPAAPAPIAVAPATPATSTLFPPSLSPPAMSPPSPASAPPADGELALLATAVRKLRTDADPQGALAVLDQHQSRFPAGALTREASLARVEALLALGRRGDALQVLEGAAIDDLPRARAVRTTRGELRAERGQCAGAVKDFERLLSANQRDEYAERALYGRAACRARAGQVADARADLALYLSLYPQGRFSAEVRRLLDGR